LEIYQFSSGEKMIVEDRFRFDEVTAKSLWSFFGTQCI